MTGLAHNSTVSNGHVASGRGPGAQGCAPSLPDTRFGRAPLRALPQPPVARAPWFSTELHAIHAGTARTLRGIRNPAATCARILARGGALLSARPKRVSGSDGGRSATLDTRAIMRARG